MGVLRSTSVGTFKSLGGYVDEYMTVVKGESGVRCDCGWPLRVIYRKELRKNAPYEFTIIHRKRERKFQTRNPSEFDVFTRMQKVATYKGCNFMKGPR